MKYCVLLPAYNEERSIAWLVKEIRNRGLDVVVVDDGSFDNTSAEAKQAGAIVLRHDKNKGKGQALRTGFDYVTAADNYAGVIIMDADGQHSPSEVNNFIKLAEDSNAGVIIGNRMQDPVGMPWVRKVTNIITSCAVSKIVGYKVPDTQCGFRFIKSEVLKAIRLSTGKYETESEILIEAARNNFKIESIPVKTIYADQKSRIQPIIDTIRFWSLILKSMSGKKKNGI